MIHRNISNKMTRNATVALKPWLIMIVLENGDDSSCEVAIGKSGSEALYFCITTPPSAILVRMEFLQRGSISPDRTWCQQVMRQEVHRCVRRIDSLSIAKSAIIIL